MKRFLRRTPIKGTRYNNEFPNPPPKCRQWRIRDAINIAESPLQSSKYALLSEDRLDAIYWGDAVDSTDVLALILEVTARRHRKNPYSPYDEGPDFESGVETAPESTHWNETKYPQKKFEDYKKARKFLHWRREDRRFMNNKKRQWLEQADIIELLE